MDEEQLAKSISAEPAPEHPGSDKGELSTVMVPPADEALHPATGSPNAWLLWLVGAASFVVVWTLLGEDSDGLTAGLKSLMWPIVAILGIGSFGLLIATMNRAHTESGHLMEASALMAKGELEEARKLYYDVALRTGSLPYFKSLALSGLASIHLEQSDLEQAKRCFFAAHECGGPGKWMNTVKKSASLGMVQVLAQGGAQGLAKEWLQKASSYKASLPFPIDDAPLTVHWARTDREQEAMARLDERWGNLKSALPGKHFDELRLLRGFLKVRVGRESPEEARQALRDVDLAVFQYLGAGWPEMSKFLEEIQSR